MPSPIRGKLETAMTVSAVTGLAWERSSWNSSMATSSTTNVRARPYRRANVQIPSRWVRRRTGAMNVYSMVPSQRYHVTENVISMNTIERYAQSSAPTSR